jgi:predicted Zn-dependent protease
MTNGRLTVRVSRFALPVLRAAAGAVLAAALCSCSTIAQVGTSIGQAAGVLTPQQAESINRSAVAVEKTFQDITPEQEYYIGRAVAATVLGAYRPYGNPEATQYLNLLGQTLAQASDAPETFGGYHFIILDTDEINAFAAPGGFILVSRGMLRCCRSEDALAAVLAHEIGHVEGKHGLRAIRKGRLTAALTTLAAEGAKSFGGQELAQLTEAFEGTIGDITSTLMNSGYARALESQADQAAVKITRRVGYDPAALVDMLGQMKRNLKPGGHDFAKTHPDPEDRIADVRGMIGAAATTASPPARQERFERALAGIH